MRKDRMLAIALGVPRAKARPPTVEPDDGDDDASPEGDDDGDYGAGEDDGSGDPEAPADDHAEEARAAAGDLMDAVRSRDPMAVFDAFRALLRCAESYGGDDDDGDRGGPDAPPDRPY